jgi:hypothetical protein
MHITEEPVNLSRNSGMRKILVILALISFLSPKAQTHLPVNSMSFSQSLLFPGYPIPGDSSQLNKKWFFTKYAAISTGAVFYNGGGGTFLSAPVGLQLNHPLNNNVIAFAGISAAPTFFNYNSLYTGPVFNKSYPGSYMANPYSFGINSRVDIGLMYINDARTFSISGSIGVERGTYPVYYPSNRVTTKKQ